MRFGGLDEVPESGDNTSLEDWKSLDDSNDDLVDEAGADCESDRRRVHASQEGSCWQAVDGGSKALLALLKKERLQNCGVLGLHCVLQVPEVDGFVDVDTQASSA